MQNKISMNMIKEEIEFINKNLSYFSNIMRYMRYRNHHHSRKSNIIFI